MKPLENFTIIDLSHRLPGPLAGKVLRDLGANVIKIEDEKYGDPFLDGFFNQNDPSFADWYKELNGNKKIVKLNFKSESIKQDLKEFLQKADGIILSLSEKLKINLGLTAQEIKLLNPHLAVIEMESSSEFKMGMHDLNAMALSGLLKLYLHNQTEKIVNPPFLPVGGISFGQQVATHLLSLILKAKKEQKVVWDTAFLLDTVKANLACFYSQYTQKSGQNKFLHNGRFPCYSLYRLKDGNYVALAAVEEKFWADLIQILPISLPIESRFDTKQESFNLVANVLNSMTTSELEEKTKNKDLCLTIVRL
jgi:alpha-methylacyl-CoA racemase